MTKKQAAEMLKLLLEQAERASRFFEAAALRMAITSLTNGKVK